MRIPLSYNLFHPLSACVRAKGAFLIKMALFVPEFVVFVEMTCAFFKCANLYKCSMFILIHVPWKLCRILVIKEGVVK